MREQPLDASAFFTHHVPRITGYPTFFFSLRAVASILLSMHLLPFENLPVHKPRRFVPGQTVLGDWNQISTLFDQLEADAVRCATANDLEQWLLDWGELCAALDEESSKRYIAMTCHTDSADAERAYLSFVETIEPRLKPRQFKLDQIYLQHPLRDRLSKAR